MKIFRTPIRIIRTNLRAYLWANALVYGTLLVGFVIGLIFPALPEAQIAALDANGTTALLTSLLSNAWVFALAIVGNNVLRFAVPMIMLPSMIVPFAGIAISTYQSFAIGVTLAPLTELAWVALIPHSLTVVVEFQAYVLLVLGAYLLGKAWVRPASVGGETRRQGYLVGLRQLGWLGVPALALLIVGAFYEAFSIVYLVPPLIQLLVEG